MSIISHRKLLLTIAAFVMLGSAFIIMVFGLRLGIDFTGGSLTEVAYIENVPSQTQVEEVVRQTIGDTDGFSVRGSSDEAGRSAYLIRTRDLDELERVALSSAVLSLSQDGEVTRFTSIGPVIGQELKDKAGYAVAGVVLVIVFYVAFAFAGIGTPVSSWVYGFITILVLVHDVLVPTALMSLLGYFAGVEVDVLFVMALLAVLGYSVNDTIVIFDRVRENLQQNRTEHKTVVQKPGFNDTEEVTYTLTAPYDKIVGTAVSGTLVRSINTSVTTFLALIALYFVGGEVTNIFALILLAGVLAGTYSSLCIASPLVVAYEEWSRKKAKTADIKADSSK